MRGQLQRERKILLDSSVFVSDLTMTENDREVVKMTKDTSQDTIEGTRNKRSCV